MLPLLSALLACSSLPPRVEAHRAAAGYYPENSRLAVSQSLEDGYDGIEIDLVLTSDGIPVLSHDPWVHSTLCERVDGEPVREGVRIDALTLEALRAEYLCGGVPDPEHPNAVVLAETMMAFDEVLDLLADADADVLVHLDIKAEQDLTPPAEDFAEQILGRWFAADPSQPFYVSAAPPETIGAFENWARRSGHEVPTSLSWPALARGGDLVGTGLSAELATTVGLGDPIAEAEAAGADGLMIYWELARRDMVVHAREKGLDVAIWTLNEPALMKVHSRWPVTTLITDYPGDLP